ncbi:MAG: hypothetical protein LBK64_01160 [Spirochaetaceae bacterium]|jgi:hypothetical protein|nr:hypothetical protein [Spirochaetaceae bacterium]
MKKGYGFFAVALALAVLAPALSAQTKSLKSMNLSGATGLYSIPTGRIGWERSADVGLDFGYHTIIDDKINHIPAVSASLFHLVELSLAFDIQPNIPKPGSGEYGNNDLLLGFKFQLPTTSTAIALGGSFQAINLGDSAINTTAFQIYAAVTYPGTLFGMPSETSVVVGKTFREHNTSDIDFGMGFDLVLLPKIFQNYIHWITDFSNFDYSVNAWPNYGASAGYGAAAYRGVLNTGVRVDIAAAPSLSKYKFAIDVMITDCFDKDRNFSLGLTAGIPLK